MPKLLLLLFLFTASSPVFAQTIRGEVLEMEEKQVLEGVRIENIHASLVVSTSTDGSFLIAASGGQLLEFSKNGYKTVRVRVPQGYIPPYFRIIMKKGIPEATDVNGGYAGNRYNYTHDSIVSHELYKHELDFPKLSGFDAIASPFSAMSSKNRAIWQFQDDYANMEKDKYVDKTFNAPLITKLTGLQGDSLRYYMRRYRPSYEQLKTMSDYAFFNFIKESVKHYRNISTPRNAQ